MGFMNKIISTVSKALRGAKPNYPDPADGGPDWGDGPEFEGWAARTSEGVNRGAALAAITAEVQDRLAADVAVAERWQVIMHQGRVTGLTDGHSNLAAVPEPKVAPRSTTASRRQAEHPICTTVKNLGPNRQQRRALTKLARKHSR